MKVVFRVTEADGSQRESFAVALVGGLLVVTGDTEAARRLGVPTTPLRFPVAAGSAPGTRGVHAGSARFVHRLNRACGVD
jgi:hypothetical protein